MRRQRSAIKRTTKKNKKDKDKDKVHSSDEDVTNNELKECQHSPHTNSEMQTIGVEFVSQYNTTSEASQSMAQSIDQKTLVVNQHLSANNIKGLSKNNYRPKASSITCDSNDHNLITKVKGRPVEDNSNISVKRFWEEKQKISLSRERRATRILGIVMGVFVACWWVTRKIVIDNYHWPSLSNTDQHYHSWQTTIQWITNANVLLVLKK